ncbi:MMPL family transporter [Halolamina sp. CBA1230]|uniref:efflux RND transporter permease subunit n=1 Tax=Halolamina sp. CBA1230 TaxID=1853690 RepID=UPI001301CEA8|nr:MMPL family transporter [Halolamina sp. CBA1230]QKY19991.1 MMPL family transporter [Halolamina sp. CBA1230]
MVLLSGLVVAGIPQLETGSQAGADADAFDDVERVQKAQYVQSQFGGSDDGPDRTFETVYVRDEDGTVLSKESLLAGLRYQRTIRENATVDAALHEDGVTGLSNLVAKRAAGSQNASLGEQIRALEGATPAEVERLVERTLANDPRALRYLPTDHERNETAATDRRMLVAFDADAANGTVDNATAALYHTASDRSAAGLFVVNAAAWSEASSQFFTEMVELVVPAALAFILVVLGFAYRDLVDVIVGMVGVVLSVLWMFGLLGWLGVAAGTTSIIPVVLVAGLSIDYGFHVFNRYREQRGDEEGIRAPMRRGVTLVATALVLVTVTAAIGFLANLANPLPMIRNLGVSITLGVVSSLLIFVTVVPALKVGIDGLLERFGFDRHKQPLGHGRYLRPVLSKAVTLARRGAPVVLVLALVVGTAGGVAWMDLNEESYQQNDGQVAEWKQELPDPIGWDTHPVPERSQHVEEVYQPASTDAAAQEPILIEGAVTADDTLEELRDGVDYIEEQELLIDRADDRPVTSPVTAMHAVAADNESFAAVLEDADTDGNGVPDRNLEGVYDAFYAADSDVASRVIERDDDEYESVLVTLSLDADYAEANSVVTTLADGADRMGGDGRTATVAGNFAVSEALLGQVVEGILTTMLLALVAIALTLAAVFRYMHGSATLGLVVSIPIALVLGLVIGGMYLMSIPLTLLTALLMSLVIGLGVDYNIHVGDRFADERRAGASTFEALDAAVTGTGGALLGSTLTSAGAFATITLVPHPQLQSFGAIVVIAMTTAFAVSVLVLPSLLVLWDRYVPASVATEAIPTRVPQD